MPVKARGGRAVVLATHCQPETAKPTEGVRHEPPPLENSKRASVRVRRNWCALSGGGGNDDDGAITMTTQFRQFICAFGELTQCGRVELPHVVVAEPCRHRCSIIAPAHKPTHNTPHFGRPQLHTYYLSCNSGALDCTGWALLATVHDFALHSRSSRLVSLRPTAIATYSVCRHANASMRRPTQCCRRPQRTL